MQVGFAFAGTVDLCAVSPAVLPRRLQRQFGAARGEPESQAKTFAVQVECTIVEDPNGGLPARRLQPQRAHGLFWGTAQVDLNLGLACGIRLTWRRCQRTAVHDRGQRQSPRAKLRHALRCEPGTRAYRAMRR